MPQKLVTAQLRKTTPGILHTENIDDENKIAVARFFDPLGTWSWYPVEFDGENTFFGLVDGFDLEWGYFTLSELESLKWPGTTKPRIEKENLFKPTKISDLNLNR